MFFGKKRLEKENAALRAELEALHKLAGDSAPEAIPATAAEYWTPDGTRIYYPPAGLDASPLAEEIIGGVNCLIAGTAGSGKSVLLNSIIYTLLQKTPAEASLWLCDPKRVEFRMYKDAPHVGAYAVQHADIVAVLASACDTMEARYVEMERRSLRRWNGGEVYVIIDEIADLMLGPEKKRFQHYLTRLLAVGRAAGFHCIAATQIPNRQVLPANIVLNFQSRIALRCLSSIESRQIINTAGAEGLPRYGTGLFLDSSSGVRRVSIPMTEDAEIDALLDYWKNQDVAAYNVITRAAKRRRENQEDTVARARRIIAA